MRQFLDDDPRSPRFGEVCIEGDNGLVYTMAEYDLLSPQGDPDEEFDTSEMLALDEQLAEKHTSPAPTKIDPRLAKLILTERILSTAQLLSMPDPNWFIEGLIPESQTLVLHGDTGSRKTFLALDWMLCAALGRKWHGRTIPPGKVLYIIGEGTVGLPKRIRAWAHGNNVKLTAIKNVDWKSMPINFYQASEQALDNWRDFCKLRDYKYIVVDTLHRAMAGGEENSAKEVGLVFDNARHIAGDAMLLFLHHDTKSKPGSRGSGSITADPDCVLTIKKTSGLTSRLGSDKMRDAEDFSHLELTFAEDDDSDSIYVATVGSPQHETPNSLLIKNAIKAQPGELTKNQICCAVSATDRPSGALLRTFAQLVEDNEIYSEFRPNPSPRGKRQISVWFVNEDEEVLTDGLDLEDD